MPDCQRYLEIVVLDLLLFQLSFTEITVSAILLIGPRYQGYRCKLGIVIFDGSLKLTLTVPLKRMLPSKIDLIQSWFTFSDSQVLGYRVALRY